MVAVKGTFARSTGIEVQSFGVTASTSITQGKIVEVDANGHVKTGTTSGTVEKGLGVALETVDNSSGSAGAKQCRVAVGNSFVYIESGGSIKVGHAVKCDSAGDAIANTGVFASETLVGRYISHADEILLPTNAVDGDTIIVRLGL